MNNMRTRIVAEARGWIGTPYRHQASMKGAGCDCLGLVRGVWRALMDHEAEAPPPYSPDWAEAAKRETLLEAARRHLTEREIAEAWPGDVLLFRIRPQAMAKHLGILATEQAMIHAMEGAPVSEVALGAWWRRRIVAVFAFPGVE